MTTANEARRALLRLIQDRINQTMPDWFESAQKAQTLDALNECLGQIRKRFGSKHLVAGFAERDKVTLETPWGPVRCGQWRTHEAARTWLMATVAATQKQPYAFLYDAYDQGETETRVSALKAINFVEDTDVESGLKLIHDAGRTYLDALLSAAWCNHPFSSSKLSDIEYRKAVLKSIFCEVPIDGFIGLEDRADEEMAASLSDFANEREAAGRPVPDMVWIVSAIRPRPGLVARLLGRLEHPLPQERLVAARALRNAADARALVFLEERLAREEDSDVIVAIKAAIAASGPDS